MTQIGMFDGSNPLKIKKPIRLIECFAGYGSQALALKYLGVEFEHWKIAEWAVKSIQAYKDMHFHNDNTDYSAKYSKEWLVDFLFEKCISADYNKPMTKEQIARMGEDKIRTVYNNIIATNNLVSVTNVKGEDLQITDTDNYTYILTYSFPCQDLSQAGLSKGMKKGSGTRSGLLWEIERILDECEELPQILLMENVPQVIGEKNRDAFRDWFCKLESLGYKSYYKIMNGKDYEMPQNRERCFMVSCLGDYYYDFPHPKLLKLRLKDMLENEVDDKYYLSDKTVEWHTLIGEAKCEQVGELQCQEIKVEINSATKSGYEIAEVGDSIDIAYPKSKTRRGRVGKGVSQTLMTSDQMSVLIDETRVFDYYNKKEIDSKVVGTITSSSSHNGSGTFFVQQNTDYRIRKLTPKECFRLMGVKDEDFDRVAQNQSNSSLYHLAGDSIITNCLMAIFKEML